MRRAAIGIDVGGTKVAGLRVADDGEVLDDELAPTPAEDPVATMDTITDVALRLLDRGPASAVGIGAAGIVGFAAGVMRASPNIAYRELAIRDIVAERTGLPCVLDNDATAAAWGEYRFGGAAGYRDVLAVTVGTGIGGGIIAGGAPYRGAHGFAAEIGHIIVEPGGPVCGCGNRGCWEQVASGQALDRLGREAAAGDPGGLVASLADGDVTGYHVADAAAKGDERAREIVVGVGRRLGEGIAGLVNVLDPEVVVLGGGVAEIGELLLSPVREAFVASVEFPEHRPEVPIVAARLGNRAGAIGAAALALEEAG